MLPSCQRAAFADTLSRRRRDRSWPRSRTGLRQVVTDPVRRVPLTQEEADDLVQQMAMTMASDAADGSTSCRARDAGRARRRPRRAPRSRNASSPRSAVARVRVAARPRHDVHARHRCTFQVNFLYTDSLGNGLAPGRTTDPIVRVRRRSRSPQRARSTTPTSTGSYMQSGFDRGPRARGAIPTTLRVQRHHRAIRRSGRSCPESARR